MALEYALKIVRKRMDEHYAKHDVDVRHVWILLEAKEDSTRSSQGKIAEYLGINLNVMVRLVDEMEKRGLIARKRNPKNRRETLLEPTSKGEELMSWWAKTFDKLAALAFDPIPLFQVNNARSWALRIIDTYQREGK